MLPFDEFDEALFGETGFPNHCLEDADLDRLTALHERDDLAVRHFQIHVIALAAPEFSSGALEGRDRVAWSNIPQLRHLVYAADGCGNRTVPTNIGSSGVG